MNNLFRRLLNIAIILSFINLPCICAAEQYIVNIPASTEKSPYGKWVPKPWVNGESVVLMDAYTGKVLYAKNAHTRRPIASTTKIMTAALLIENCKLDDVVKASKKCTETLFTSIHLKEGEEISVKDLLTAMLVRSANDAAVATAEHISGSVPKFAEKMNEKAREIGCKDTHFVNPNGLYEKNHYSTAYDLCLMTRYAQQYPVFNEITTIRKKALITRTLNKMDLVVFNKSKFLKHYVGADGVKSGYVKQAGYCYVGSATRNGWRLISAVLKSDNAGRDTGMIMDYGFGSYMPYTIVGKDITYFEAPVMGGDKNRVSAVCSKELRIVVSRNGARAVINLEPEPINAPVEKGAKIGKVYVVVDGKTMISADLQAADSVGISLARKVVRAFVYGLLIFSVAGGLYGAALTKNYGGSRNWISTFLRETYRKWKSFCKW